VPGASSAPASLLLSGAWATGSGIVAQGSSQARQRYQLAALR
jgi:hypothetical protein